MEIPSGYAQANFRYTGVACPSGSEWTLGINLGSIGDTATELAERLANIYAADTDLAQIHTSEAALTSVYVKFGPTNIGDSGEYSTLVTGTAATPTTPPQVAALVKKQTAAGGRAGRGRLYFPALPEAQISGGGLLGDATITGLKAGMDDLAAAIVLAGGTPVVLHGAGSPITTPSPITGFVVATRCATQRRRNRPA